MPFRRFGNDVELCLITSNSGKWIFPKGLIEVGRTSVEAALQEAFEEAGLHGRILGEPLGSYALAKNGTSYAVEVLLMEVTRCDTRWPEAGLRKRRWVAPSHAKQLLARKELRRQVDLALERILAEAGE